MKIKKLLILFAILFGIYSTAKAEQVQENLTQTKAKAEQLYRAENFPAAQEHFIKCMEMAEEAGDERTYIICTGYIGNIYETYGDYENAVNYWLKGYRMAVQNKETRLKENLLTNIVMGFCRLNKPHEARRYHELSIKANAGKRPNDIRQYYLLYNEARILYAEQKYMQAIKAHQAARVFAQSKNMDIIMLLYQDSEIGKIYLETAEYDKAISYGRQCLQTAKQINNKELQANAYNILTKAYRAIGKQKEAEEYGKLGSQLAESLYNFKQLYNVKNKLAEYEGKVINRQIDSLHYRISRQLITIIIISLFVIVLCALIYVILRKNRKLRAAQIMLIAKNNELVNSDRENRRLLKQYISSIRNNETKDDNSAAQPDKAADTFELSQEQTDIILNRINGALSDISIISNPEFNLNALADIVKSNTKYVSWVINVTYNKNFKSLLNEYRIQEACRRLSDTEHYGKMTIQAIYEEVGYKNNVSFIRAFKRVMGMTPSIYQRLSHISSKEIESA